MSSPEKTASDEHAIINSVGAPVDPVLAKDSSSDSASITTKNRAPSVYEKTSFWFRRTVFPHVWSPQIGILWLVTSVIVVLYALMYLGGIWDPMAHIHNAKVGIFNDDAGFTTLSSYTPQSQAVVTAITQGVPMGNAFAASLLGTPALRARLDYFNATDTMDKSHASAIDAVDKGDFWGVIYIPRNFSDNFLTALNLNTSDGSVVQQTTMGIEYIFDQGRSYTISNFVNQIVTGSISAITQGLALKLANGTSGQPTLVKPTFYISPIYLAQGRRFPVLWFGANLATYISLLVVWLSSMLTVTVITKLFLEKIPHLTGVKTAQGLPAAAFSSGQIMFASMVLGVIFTFFHSLWLFICLYGLGGRDLFVHGTPGSVFGFLFFFSLACFGFIALLCVLVGVDALAVPAALFLIFQIVSSGAIVDHVGMPGIMRAGAAFPFYWGLRIMKAHVFGTGVDVLWQSYVVLVAWIVISNGAALLIGTLKIGKWRKHKILEGADAALTVLGGTMRAPIA
ncbi:hypothetical protein HDU86_004613 [Geranomyces michiganensis]|nr:hypothetical protein HDU86_004613 [Geranomyces michiganensis]